MTIDREALDEVKTIMYLGNTTDKQWESDADVREWTAFLKLKNLLST